MLSKAPQTRSTLPGTASAGPPVAAAALKGGRFLFIDNLRILLISLVAVQHLSVTYGATGSWYYRDPATNAVAGTFLTLWDAPGQAAGMGLFFLIAAYFTPGSYDHKGAHVFLRDRLIRLGIPLLVYVLLLDPVVEYMANGLHGSYWSAYGSYLLHLRGVTGPVWFIAVLLVFTLLYAAWRELTWHRPWTMDRLLCLPSDGAILAFVLALGMATFCVRIWWPVNVIFQPLNVSIGYLPQYASMFVLGVIAYRGDWFCKFTPRMAKTWSLVALLAILVLIGLAIPLFRGGAGRSGNDLGTLIAGGFHWQALFYAAWEPFILVGACIGLLVLLRERLNWQGQLAKEASASAYTVYLIHPLVLVPFCYAFQPVELYPLLKFVVAILITLPLCFLASSLVRRVPVLDTIL